MNILIVEDEKLAAKKLVSQLENLNEDNNIVGIVKSVEAIVSAVDSLEIDLGFFDIQIEDGISLDAFERTSIDFPIIFTTAFNEYAIKAFKLNSIDYLLKPISQDELRNAISKYHSVWKKGEQAISGSVIEEVKKLISGSYKDRFTIRIGNKIEIIQVADICYFFSFEKGSYARTKDHKDRLLDSALDNIFPLLDPKQFFRISRKYIININYIKNVYLYSNSRLRINTILDEEEELIVSREKVGKFKEWLDGV